MYTVPTKRLLLLYFVCLPFLVLKDLLDKFKKPEVKMRSLVFLMIILFSACGDTDFLKKNIEDEQTTTDTSFIENGKYYVSSFYFEYENKKYQYKVSGKLYFEYEYLGEREYVLTITGSTTGVYDDSVVNIDCGNAKTIKQFKLNPMGLVTESEMIESGCFKGNNKVSTVKYESIINGYKYIYEPDDGAAVVYMLQKDG